MRVMPTLENVVRRQMSFWYLKIIKEEGLSATSPLQPLPPPRAQTSEFDVSCLVIKRSPISSKNTGLLFFQRK